MAHVLVLGAGLCGLSTALLLARDAPNYRLPGPGRRELLAAIGG